MPNAVTKPTRILLGASFVIALSGLPSVSTAHAATKSVAPRIELAMMDEMSQGVGMGGMTSGRMGGMPGGMRRPEMGGDMGSMGMPPGAGTPMAMPSALPGFPGASHLYHVGATGFFLDYADKLNFTVDQTTALNTIKQRALSDQSAAQRKIDEAEQAFWMITAADQPDAAAIEPKLREIEKLRSDMRLAFIRAVGESAKVLTAEQRKMVLGMAPMPGAPAKPK